MYSLSWIEKSEPYHVFAEDEKTTHYLCTVLDKRRSITHIIVRDARTGVQMFPQPSGEITCEPPPSEEPEEEP